MKKLWDVAVAGEIFADHVLSGFARWPEPGEELQTEAYVREAGGGAAITACALGRLGRKVAVFAVAGAEDSWLHARLRSCGVDLEGLRLVEESTAVTVSLSTREERSFFTWPGANRGLGRYLTEPATLGRLAQARHVHFAAALDRELARTIFAPLRRAGCTLSIDPGYQAGWLAEVENRQTCAECDFFLPNEKEGGLMTGASAPEEMLVGMRSFGIGGAVLKLGARGAMALLDGRVLRALPPTVTVVDTTGAGDAFDAGLIDGVLDGLPLERSMERACRLGALSTREAGAITALPGREEMEDYGANVQKS